MSDLFRQNAIDHQRERVHGAILLTQDRSQTLWTTVLCGLVLAITVFAYTFRFARHEVIVGHLVPEAVAQIVRAPSLGGTIAEVHVTRGQIVSPGTPLFTLETTENPVHGAAGTLLQTYIVRAKREGQLISVKAEQADQVTPGQLLGIVAPIGSGLEAELYAPARMVGLVRPGTPISIRYDAFPSAQLGHQTARIRTVSAIPMPAASAAANKAALNSSDAVYRLRARLPTEPLRDRAGLQPALEAGMGITGVVELEHHTLFDWIIEPLVLARGSER